MIERQLAELLEGTADAAFAVDLQGDVRIWNKAAERFFGYPASLAIGTSCLELIGGRFGMDSAVCRESCDTIDCVRKGLEISNFDMEVRTRAGQLVWVNVSLLSASDERTGRRLAVHFMRDISERKKAEHLTGEMFRIAQDIVNGAPKSNGLPPISTLTAQESHILLLLASGKTTLELTADLQISIATLRNHINHINRKLHTRSRIESVVQAIKRGLI